MATDDSHLAINANLPLAIQNVQFASAAAAQQAHNDRQWEGSVSPVPEIEFDQRIAW